MATKRAVADPKAKIQERTQEILRLTDGFCRQHLTEEYAQLCQKLVLKMSRKRAVPYVGGSTQIWAGAVVYALGQINFLFDKSQKPYTTPATIAEHFGTTVSTLGQKAKAIRDLFKLHHWDGEFSAQEMAARNPLGGMGMVGGFIVPQSILEQLVGVNLQKKG